MTTKTFHKIYTCIQTSSVKNGDETNEKKLKNSSSVFGPM